VEKANGTKGIGPVQRFGRYTLVKRIATGGMAEIWLARQSGLAGFNRFVVIKRILSHLSEQSTFVDMFLDEARTSALLNHPNAVQIYDLGREGEAYFIAMEYIAGENLSAIAWRGTQREQPLPIQLAVRIIVDASKALHYAHHLRSSDGRWLRIVHRDVSPQNILVTYDGEVKVVDFGIAKAATRSEHTKTGMLKGKFSYMSPEQCLGAPVDMRADVFALGILLYEMCTGHRLFKHESELMILDMITKRAVVPPSSLAPHVPAELERIILRALQKEASDRYPHARALQQDLEAFLRSHPGPSSHADLASHMRSLFQDRIEEKRRILEIASRDDFEERFGVGPDAVTVRSAAGTAGPVELFTGPTAAASADGAEPPSAGTAPDATRAVPSRQRWLSLAAMALALVVIAASVSVLWGRWGASSSVFREAAAPGFQGRILVDSIPAGATIYLDGEPMRHASGEFARTPSEIGPLSSRRTYRLELRKEGYAPYLDLLELTAELDGARLRPRLAARPGRVRVRAEGDAAARARLRIDGEPVGSGAEVRRKASGGQRVKVEAELSGHSCLATPSPVRVPPGGEVEVRVRCTLESPPTRRSSALSARRAPNRASRRAAGAQAETRSSAVHTAAAGSPEGCETRADLPPGFITIDTRPHSEIFWRGRRLGETPLAKYELPSGCVELVARGEAAARTFRVRVEPNQVAIYRLELEE
jgi:serine/threonine protein kinase